ncbi:MAG: peptidoglycan glycosyltransferase [Lachnospiraceae bacterium]|nr:peptidoglycan glycosyltransferase [Lachnospiraceae bacterium]
MKNLEKVMEQRNHTYLRKKIAIVWFLFTLCLAFLCIRIGYLMIFRSEYYSQKAIELHERERSIKAARGRILDATGIVLADNETVCTISVIHSQIKDPEKVIEVLSKELSLSKEYVRKRVEKVSSIEKIKSNVTKELGDIIRNHDLDGVKVDEDYKRYYPYGELASKVLGFTGADNQGIIGLEVKYDSYLEGTKGTILTVTDAKGVEIEDASESRIEPVAGNDLITSIDINIQTYATQLAYEVMEKKEAQGVSILVMNPKNGAIMAMVNVPEFDLNNHYILTEDTLLLQGIDSEDDLSQEESQNDLNYMWRNACINDTYEPGSIFKVVTAAIGLENNKVTAEDEFYCPGYIVVEDRRIRCSRTRGHGSESFVVGTMNSCNPVFITVGLRIGAGLFYDSMNSMGLLNKTGVDLPGEAGTIMHKKDTIGEVELATISFGQSFQVTPIQMATTVASIVNGGNRITPHVGVKVVDSEGITVETFSYETDNRIISEETSETMRQILEKVVSEGGGKNAAVEGYCIGGKTATSETLPRGTGKYISSFVGFYPANDPKVLALVVIHKPTGMYYGGQVAAPVVKQLFQNILPYLDLVDYN